MKRVLTTVFFSLLLQYGFLSAQLDHFDFDPISNAGAGDPISVHIYAKEAGGRVDTLFTNKCKISDITGSMTPDSTDNFIKGEWTGNVVITTAYQNDKITVEYLSVSSESGTFDISPAGLDHFTFDPVGSPQEAGVSFWASIDAEDEYGNLVTGFLSTVNLDDVTGSLTPTSATFSGGQWSGSLTVTQAVGIDSVRAWLGGSDGYSNSFTVDNGSLHHFDFDPIGSSQEAGVPFSASIDAEDEWGNLVDDFGSTVNMIDVTGSLTPTSATFSGGQWSGSLTVTQAVSIDSIFVWLIGVNGYSNSFSVDNGSLHHFDFDPIVSPQEAGVPFLAGIDAEDEWGNLVDDFAGTADLDDVTGSLTPTSATFSGGEWDGSLTVTEAVDIDSVTAEYSGSSGSSNSFSVGHGSIDHFAFSPISSPQEAGVAFLDTLGAYDVYGNRVKDFNNTVNIEDVTGTLSPTSVPLSSGWWTGDLTITQAVNVDSLTASFGGNSGSSNTFIVDNASLHHFDFDPIISSQEAGVPFSAGIDAEDEYGNLVDDFGSTVNLNDVTGTLSPTTVNFSGGQWSGMLTVTQAVSIDSIFAWLGGSNGYSNSFSVDNGSLHHFDFDPIVSPQEAGVPFLAGIDAEDEWGNLVDDFVGTADLNDVTGSLTPTSATFNGGQWSGTLGVTEAVAVDSVTASYFGSSGSSNAFEVTHGPLARFDFNNISNKVAGTPFQITIAALDVYDNIVQSFTNTVQLLDLTGTLEPSMSGNFTGGVWSDSVTIYTTYTNDKIFAIGSGKSGESNLFDVVATQVDHFDFNTITGNKNAGEEFSITITAKDINENIVLSYNGLAFLTDLTGTINPNQTIGGFQNGQWTGNVSMTAAMFNDQITAEDTENQIEGTSNTFHVLAGPLDHFGFAQISNQTAGPFEINMMAYDQYENVVLGFNDAVTLTDSTGTIFPTTSGNFTNGERTELVTVTLAMNDEWIGADYVTVSDRSNLFDVSPGALDHFDFETIEDQMAGAPFSITIRAYDVYANLKTNFISTAALSDLSGTIYPDVTGQFAGGIWTGDVTITTSYVNDTITAQASNKIGTSNSFTVMPAGLDHFEFAHISNQVAGVPFSVDVTALDSLGNIVTSFNSDIQLYDQTGSYSDTVTMSGGQASDSATVTVALSNDYLTADFSGIQDQSNNFTVSPGNPENLLLSPPDPFSITVGTSQVFEGIITDPYSNPVPGANITFVLKSFVNGFLSDNPNDSNNTLGNSSVQTGTADDDGLLTVLYTAPQVSGLKDTLDGRNTPYIPQAEVVDVTITTVDSGATKLVVLPEDPQPIIVAASEVFSITIEAQDGFGNVDDDDTTRVRFVSANGQMEFSNDDFDTTLTELKLTGGTATLQVRSCLATDYDTITVSDIDSVGILLAPYSKSEVFINSDVPAGTVQLSASPDTLTADGSSTTTITSMAIVDSCGNIVQEGTYVTVSASLGTITSPDQNPSVPGRQVETDNAGRIAFDLRTGTTSGTCTINAASLEGSAEGTVDVLFQEPAFLVYSSGSLVPNTVSPGDSVSFLVLVRNEGEAGVTISTASRFLFSDGVNNYQSILTTPTNLAGGSDWDTLTFAIEKVPDAILIDSYTPLLDLEGTDFNNSQYDQALSLETNALQISNMSILMVQVPDDTVSIEDSIGVTLVIENSGALSITLEEYGLSFTPAGDFVQFTETPVILPPGVPSYVSVGIKVNSDTNPGKYLIDGFASGTSGGSEIGDNSADLTDSLVVISLATAEYVDGSLNPSILSPGGQYSMRVRVMNNGESSVNLFAQNTKMSFSDDVYDYESHLSNTTNMAGGGAVTELIFGLETLENGFSSGNFSVDLYLSGQTPAQGAFNQSLPDIDSVAVQSAPLIQYIPGSISQTRVSKGYPVRFSMRVSNTGEAALDLTSGNTSLYMCDDQGVFEPAIDLSEVTAITSGDTTIVFQSAILPSGYEGGQCVPLIDLDGEYNNIAYRDTLSADPVLIQDPATLSVNAQRTDTVVTIGQSFIVEAIIENRGEAGIADEGSLFLDLSGTDFSVTETTKSFGPSLPDTVAWTVTVSDTGNVGLFDISVEIDDLPHDENTEPPQPAILYQGGRDIVSVSVVEGNELVVKPIEIAGFPPRNVHTGQNGIPMMVIELTNSGNAKNEVRLDSVKVSIREANGDSVSPPSQAINDLYITTDREGSAVLASATDLAGDKVLLDLTNADYRLGTASDTVYLFMDLRQSSGFETILLHLDGDEDFYATDLSNGRTVTIVDVLGAQLAEFMSDFVVLSSDDFRNSFKNYPNPFRAGSELTTFAYYLSENARVSMQLYTLTGELVKTFSLEPGTPGGSGPGLNTFTWDGQNGNGHIVLNGVYVCLVMANLESGSVLSLKHKVAVMK